MTRRTRRRRRIYSPTTKSHRGFLSESVWSTSSEDSQKRKRWLGRFIFLIHERRKGEANAQPTGMMVRQSRAGEGVAGSCKFDPSGGGEVKSWGGWSSCLSLSLSQPSIPKSSVNFFTFSRSSVLTVGRVVDSERNMSDCRGSRDTSLKIETKLATNDNELCVLSIY